MGVRIVLSLVAIFAIGSFSVHIPNNNKNPKYGKSWVVLVAGTEGWINYRHQADICHAYQICVRNGFPPENIITMMVDDIAFNPLNPNPGTITNNPDHSDVYGGIFIDYTGTNVTADNFLKVISGDKELMSSIGSGRVVEGGPHDTIFINIVTHGTDRILSFPNSYLYADQLDDTLIMMYRAGKYSKILFYVEASKAGSMFDGILNENMAVMAITATGPRENSYACYCEFDNGNKSYQTCLGDVFSVKWMNNYDSIYYDIATRDRTVFKDFQDARMNVTKSNVMMYGDFHVGHEALSTFIGNFLLWDLSSHQSTKLKSASYSHNTIQKTIVTIPDRDVQIHAIENRLTNDKLSTREKDKLKMELYQNNKRRLIIDNVFRVIYSKIEKRRPDIKKAIGELDETEYLTPTKNMLPCYRSILNEINDSCFSLSRNPYLMNRLKIIINLCVIDRQIHLTVTNFIRRNKIVSCSSVGIRNKYHCLGANKNNMGTFHLVSLALLAVGTIAAHISNHENLDNFLIKDNSQNGGKKWVILVAGSNGWDNYRHQADICHAYQIVVQNEIPKDQIITMIYDDIAYNPENPRPGVIINQPNGTDVYSGVEIDYKGENVTSANFLRVITGDVESMQSIGTGKVVEGGPRDTIFIFFSDHGGPGLLGFPSDLLYADQLYQSFNKAFETAQYKKMLVYIEACESGSMFDGILDDDMNILAITASGPREDSWACYCSSDEYDICLGDEFSVSWMENIDAVTCGFTARERNIYNIFDQVRTAVGDSNVMAYGDFGIGFEKLSTFIGYSNHDSGLEQSATAKRNSFKKETIMSSRDVSVKSMEYKLASADLTHEMKQDLAKTLRKNYQMRLIIDSVFRAIYSKVVEARPDIQSEIGSLNKPKHRSLTLDMFPCYRSILNKISESCFSLPKNPYTLDQLKIFANLCVVDNQIHQTVSDLVEESCLNIPKNIINVV
ncbi:Peptidase C13, legumain [Cinara cedri]|uniref:legumain n=1 Tax=Cinara cedri TaxID=506608 RepID=A0A5E4N6E5_9HEMI|nr:Peptidase C13, legumain [Cinara cedri]